MQRWISRLPILLILFQLAISPGKGCNEDDPDPFGSDEDVPKKLYCGPTKEACGTPFPGSQEPRCYDLKDVHCKSVGKYIECYCQLNPPEVIKDIQKTKKARVAPPIPVGRQFQKLYPTV